ncbi:hypothetical protein SAMN05920897_10352 [Alkalispirochaeta americana]|uniref:Uncharacterized protein n=1 Tax=Alkalispirochaeta americana TaxID=159291 RepID=A0A1N6PMS6_9SPIO|nr:hypothetical protein [Alkalispirochaeta americana]SIQ05637.1 hypothetical protein SAMN05920897_10352 [Alkalispirochaeta americana]
MEEYLKVAGVAAGLAVLIAVLAGILAGVGFGTVVVRALGAALVFALGSLGITLFAQRFLPGLVDPLDSSPSSPDRTVRESSSGRGDASSAPGSTLNIVVEDEQFPSDAQEMGDDGLEGEASSEKTSPPDEKPLVEEVEEQRADGDEAVAEPPDRGGPGDRSQGVDESDLDEMPDIGSFAGSFVSRSDDEQQQEGEGFSDDSLPEARGSSTSGGSGGQDTAQIAKALRTMIARDE